MISTINNNYQITANSLISPIIAISENDDTLNMPQIDNQNYNQYQGYKTWNETNKLTKQLEYDIQCFLELIKDLESKMDDNLKNIALLKKIRESAENKCHLLRELCQVKAENEKIDGRFGGSVKISAKFK